MQVGGAEERCDRGPPAALLAQPNQGIHSIVLRRRRDRRRCRVLRRFRECFLVGIEQVAGQDWLSLRVDAPRNGQRAAVHLAADYTLSGAIAQLGERLTGSQKVAGSSPAGSIFKSDAEQREMTVGAHRFRNHFGYWMERAAAGDEILITRRGRRYARLGPPDPQLSTTDTAPAEEPAADRAEPPPDTARTSR